MDDILIPVNKIEKAGLTIDEYLVLYNISTNESISHLINNVMMTLICLEKKGFVKLTDSKIFLRDRSSEFFAVNNDLFDVWISTYPTMVKTKTNRRRALSPSDATSILGKKLKAKWKNIFKNNILKQKKAIKVLEYQISDMQKSGDLEYMVEATRWLNEGYHEKYSYLLEEERIDNIYKNENYL